MGYFFINKEDSPLEKSENRRNNSILFGMGEGQNFLANLDRKTSNIGSSLPDFSADVREVLELVGIGNNTHEVIHDVLYRFARTHPDISTIVLGSGLRFALKEQGILLP